MRYTEARMTGPAMEMLADLEKNTVDFVPNYDETREEPMVLPGKFPNLLCNGSSGIAVGMATNIPPHNLSEIADGIVALIDTPEITDEELHGLRQGPGLPDRRHHLRPAGHPGRLRDRPRPDHRAGPRLPRDHQGRQGADHRHRDPLHGQQGGPDRADRRAGARRARSTASPTCATSPTARACGS